MFKGKRAHHQDYIVYISPSSKLILCVFRGERAYHQETITIV